MSGGAARPKRRTALEEARVRQRVHKARKRAQGLKRTTLWVPVEDVEDLKLSLGDPAAFVRLREEAKAELKAEMSERMEKWMGGSPERSLSPWAREALAAAAEAKAVFDARLEDLMHALEEAAADDRGASEDEVEK